MSETKTHARGQIARATWKPAAGSTPANSHLLIP